MEQNTHEFEAEDLHEKSMNNEQEMHHGNHVGLDDSFIFISNKDLVLLSEDVALSVVSQPSGDQRPRP